MMDLFAIVSFWSSLTQADCKQRWVHPDDRKSITSRPHSFNLDFPVSPFVGDIINAPVIILGSNAGYDPVLTPREFADVSITDEYVDQVAHPDTSQWRLISDYYRTSNSWPFVAARQAAWINASPYRSPALSTERDNQVLARDLPSTQFHNRWMQEAIVPLARSGERLVVVKRRSLWSFLPAAGNEGISVCKSFVGKHLDATVIAQIKAFLTNKD